MLPTPLPPPPPPTTTTTTEEEEEEEAKDSFQSQYVRIRLACWTCIHFVPEDFLRMASRCRNM